MIKKRIFVCQPFVKNLEKIRQNSLSRFNIHYPTIEPEFVFIEQTNDLDNLGNAIKTLATCDWCVFLDNFSLFEYCNIIQSCCLAFNVKRVYGL